MLSHRKEFKQAPVSLNSLHLWSRAGLWSVTMSKLWVDRTPKHISKPVMHRVNIYFQSGQVVIERFWTMILNDENWMVAMTKFAKSQQWSILCKN